MNLIAHFAARWHWRLPAFSADVTLGRVHHSDKEVTNELPLGSASSGVLNRCARRFRETNRSDTRSEIAHSAPFEKKKNSMSGSFTCAAGVEDVNEKRSTVRGCVLGRFCRLSGQTERSICHLCASQVREAAPSNGARRCVVLMPNGSFNSISTFFK